MGEKIRSMIERDIAIVLLLIIGGLACSKDGAHGFPFAWLYEGSTDTAAFLADLAILGGIVIGVDTVTMIAKGVLRSGDFARSRVIRNAPYTRNSTSSPAAASRTESESSRSSQDASVRQGPGAKEQDYLERMREANREFEKRSSLRNRQQRSRKSNKGNPAASMLIGLIALTIMLTAAMIPGNLTFDDDEWGDGWDDAEWIDEDSERGSAVENFCLEAINALQDGDADWIGRIGPEGDAKALVGMTFWSAADFDSAIQHNYITYGDPDELIRRYQIVTDDGVYWLAFKFCGIGESEYAFTDGNTAFAGMAACRMPDWLVHPDEGADYTEGDLADIFSGMLQLNDDDADRLFDYIITHEEYVGENESDDRPILLSM